MKRISLQEAADWINTGEAGYYSHNSEAPIAHPSTVCVFAQGAWWLVEDGAIQIIDRGIEVVSGNKWLRAITVCIPDDHPIVRLLSRDMAERRGPDLPEPVSIIIDNIPGPRRANR